MKNIVKPLHQFHHYTKKPICTHLQYIFCKPQVSYLNIRLQDPYPCKYCFGEDQNHGYVSYRRSGKESQLLLPLELKSKEAPCLQIQPIRVLDQFIFTLSHSKAQVQGGAFYPCTLYVSFIKKKGEKKKKEIAVKYCTSCRKSLVCNRCLYSLSLTSYPSTQIHKSPTQISPSVSVSIYTSPTPQTPLQPL